MGSVDGKYASAGEPVWLRIPLHRQTALTTGGDNMLSRHQFTLWAGILSAALLPVACGGEEDAAGPAPTLALTTDTDGNLDAERDADEGDDRDALRFSDWSAPVNLGSPVNTSANETGAFVSKNGRSFYFTSDRPGGCGGLDIWVSTRKRAADPWGEPQNLGCEINSSGLDAGPVLSIDGHRMYFHSDRPGGAGGLDLYASRRQDSRDDFGWRTPQNLGSGVNTAATEVLPAIFEDESGITTLYFAGRAGALGGLGATDIYRSTLQADGTFGLAALVPELSSPAQDLAPFIRRDGLELFLASARPGTLGRADLWTSTRASTSDPWSTPVHLGSVINSSEVDDRPTLSFDGTVLYFLSSRAGGLGANDIYVLTRSKLKGQD